MNLIRHLAMVVMTISLSSGYAFQPIDLMLPNTWDKAYELHLYLQMEENLRREQETSEETKEEILEDTPIGNSDRVETDAPTYEVADESIRIDPEPVPVETTSPPPETTAPPTTAASEPVAYPLYCVNGATLGVDIQYYLYERLCQAGIGWFYHYALLIAYQESNFNLYAENPNGLDKGLFQYRITYWNYGDIFNPYDQIPVFVTQMAQRAAAGCDPATMISRHKQSDWGPYDQSYVDAVMQWERVLVRIQ